MAEEEDPVTNLSDNLDLVLDELDDKEFDLPPVDNPPTLESILNEPDDDSPLQDEDLVPAETYQGDQGETGSISSVEGILEGKPKRKSKKHIRYDQHGAILRHVILKGVSAQLASASDRVDAGMPTAMAVSSLIAVGTSHGLVLIFDPKQALKWCLGSTAVGAQYGAVSALSFNKDCTRLLSGFAKGQITMWDLTNGKLLRTITDVHPPGTAILHVKFSDDLTIAVCSDSGGSVFELEFKRLIGVRTCESKCLFSGSRGEVCTIEPLHMHHTMHDHPMKDVIVLAMASLSKVLIVTVRPHLKVLYMHPLKGDSATLPLLAWQFVIIQVSESNRTIDPVLAFARDQSIHFAQVNCNGADDIKVSPLQRTELPYKLLAMTWMNSRTMVVIDTSERAHVIDVRTEEELEVVDLADVQLVYSTSFYKSLATGGNVSQALAYAGERACYQSICTFNQQMILLGVKGIHCMNIRPWRERLDVLIKSNKFAEALSLAGRFFDGKARAVVGLYGGIHKRRRVVAEKILEILEQYVDLAVTVLCPKHGKMEELEEYYQMVVPICVDNCLKLDRTDILFGTIYDRFNNDPISKGTFLECLEPYIQNDKLSSMAPSVMQDFVAHYQNKNMLQNVEACIVHMDIASLDIHQVVLMCWSHGLYDAILYIYNRGMLDYTTPLEELLLKLRLAVKSGKQLTEDQIKLGNKLLVYISCCLAGRAYPFGDIVEDQVERVKDDVFRCVTCLHTKEPDEDEPVYPHLKALLQYDTREFFNVLAIAFEEPEFKNEQGIERRQRIVDILLQIMVESIGFSPTQIGILFTFLARQMARHDNTIIVPRSLFEQVLESLCSQPEDTSRHEERQQALIELLQAGGLAHFDENKLLKLAEKAEFFRVCEMLYEKRKEFDKILSCYWRDSARKHQAFSYIQSIMQNPEFTMMDKAKIQKEALAHLKELVSIDSRRTSQLVLVSFASSLTDITARLQDDEGLLYDFLQGVFDVKDNANGDRLYQVEPHVHELFIDLLCKKSPESVAGYLRAADGYRNEETLEICRRYELSDATAFIMEKSGDIQGAFQIMLENVRNKVTDLVAVLLAPPAKPKEEHEKDTQNLWSGVYHVTDSIIDLCQRNSGKLDEVQRESLWFPLIDTVMSSQGQVKEQEHANAFKNLTRHVLNSMMSYISLPAILTKIMQDPIYSTGKFGEMKDLLLGMLDTYNYEKTLLNTCKNLVNHDLHQQLASLTVAASRGIVPRTQGCQLCGKSYLSGGNEGDQIICFRCGHGYHQPCLKATGSSLMIEGEETWLCYICNKTKRGRLLSNMRMTRLPSAGSSIMSSSKAPKKPVKQSILNPQQAQSLDNLRRVQKTGSRLQILTELARQERGGTPLRFKPQSSSILQNEHFQLRVAHPPPEFQ